jgi:pimeloyl-ACP methyl ester carboxylesterase
MKPADLASIRQPVLVLNGESDRCPPRTPSPSTSDSRTAGSSSINDAGHGGVFQFHADFVKRAL